MRNQIAVKVHLMTGMRIKGGFSKMGLESGTIDAEYHDLRF
jgi:hypothetical protein